MSARQASKARTRKTERAENSLTMQDLSRRLREVRQARGLTLKQIEEMTGIATSTLSKVQNGQASLSYANLVRLADGLGIEVAHLFSNRQIDLKTGRRAITRKGEGDIESTDRYRFEILCGELYNKHMSPAIMEIEATSLEEAGGLSSHSGEEFVYVLSGEIEIYSSDYKPVRLKPGDSLYLDSMSGHAYVRISEGPAQMLAVTTYPMSNGYNPTE